jgi:hypothetical protein
MDNKIVKAIVIVLAVIGATALVSVLGMGLMHLGMMGGMMDGMMGSGALIILLLLAIIAAVIALIIFVVRRR